jgi:hypothetical protein
VKSLDFSLRPLPPGQRCLRITDGRIFLLRELLTIGFLEIRTEVLVSTLAPAAMSGLIPLRRRHSLCGLRKSKVAAGSRFLSRESVAAYSRVTSWIGHLDHANGVTGNTRNQPGAINDLKLQPRSHRTTIRELVHN